MHLQTQDFVIVLYSSLGVHQILENSSTITQSSLAEFWWAESVLFRFGNLSHHSPATAFLNENPVYLNVTNRWRTLQMIIINEYCVLFIEVFHTMNIFFFWFIRIEEKFKNIANIWTGLNIDVPYRVFNDCNHGYIF